MMFLQQSLPAIFNFNLPKDHDRVSLDALFLSGMLNPPGVQDLSRRSSSSSSALAADPNAVVDVVSVDNDGQATLSDCSSKEKSRNQCGDCGMTFRYPSKLRRHQKIHQPESIVPKEFCCDQCPKAFRYSYHLRRHKWLIHAPDRPVFTCKVCLKSYKGEELYRLHCSMAHLPQVKHDTLSDCSSASSPKNFGVAIKTSFDHIDSKPLPVAEQSFHCDICGTSFKQKHYLKQHLMAHSKERPFICEICNKGFARASTLFAHRYVHTVGRQFRCSTCDKAFKHKRSLTEHIKSKVCFIGDATRAKPSDRGCTTDSQFLCEFCNASFVSVSYLYIHRRRCHRDRLCTVPQPRSDEAAAAPDCGLNLMVHGGARGPSAFQPVAKLNDV